jgi:hypothetical protein
MSTKELRERAVKAIDQMPDKVLLGVIKMLEDLNKGYLGVPRTDGTSAYRPGQTRRDERKLPIGN